MISCRPLSEDLLEILVKSSLQNASEKSLREDLADAMSYRCLYESSCGRLLGGSCIKLL